MSCNYILKYTMDTAKKNRIDKEKWTILVQMHEKKKKFNKI